MHVDGVIARLQIVKIQLDGDAVVRRGEPGRSHILPLPVLQVHGDRLGPLVFSPGHGKDGKQHRGTYNELSHFAYLTWRSARKSKRWPVSRRTLYLTGDMWCRACPDPAKRDEGPPRLCRE